MTSGPTYGQGFIELEPKLSNDFLTRINRQLDRAFSNINLDIDTTSLREVERSLGDITGSAGRAADNVADIAREAAESRTDFGQMARLIDQSEDEARQLARAMDTAQGEAVDLEGAARRVERELSDSATEAREMERALDRAGNAQGSVGRLSGTVSALRVQLGNAALAAAAFFGVRGIINQASLAREAFIDLGESVNAVQVVFGDASDIIFGFSDQVAQSAGLARSEFQQMATVLGAALQNAGLDADIAAEKTIELTQRAADLASVFNTDVSEALGAIQAALRGESDPIERFGVTLSAAAVDSQAAALGFSRVAGEFDSSAKAAARLSLIMEQTSRVAGDFANTSDSLANRQRIATAEMTNARAELGEALLPVFEALVAVAPEVVEGIKDLTPSIAALAESAADLAKSTPGVLDLFDVLHLFTDLPRGFGQLGDVFKTFGGLIGGTLSTLEEIGRLDFSSLGDNFTAVGDAAQSALERVNTQGLIDDLREGGDAATVLANRLVEVGRKGKLSPEFIRSLRQIAGTDLNESAAALKALVDNAERLGLSAEEVALLTAEFSRLRNEIQPVGNEIAQAALAMEGFDRPARQFPRVVTLFGDLAVAADEVGLSLADLVIGLDPVARAMTEGLTPTQETALALHAIQTEAGAAADILDANLRPAIADVGEAFKDMNEDGRVTTAEFIENAREITAAAIQLAIDLTTIAGVSAEAARELAKLPADVAAQLIRDFANDPAGILEAAQALTGTPKQLGQAILETYLAALDVLTSGDQKAIETLLAFIGETTEKSIPGVTESFTALFDPALQASFADLEPPDLTPVFVGSVEGMNASAIAASLDDVLDASFADLEPQDLTPTMTASIAAINTRVTALRLQQVFDTLTGLINLDFTDAGIEGGITLITGMAIGVNSPRSVDRLHDAIVNATNNALEAQSPSRVMLEIGESAGEAFVSGFTSVAFDFPGLDLANSFTASRAATLDVETPVGAGGPLIGSMTVNNPVGEPTEESVQAALIEVAISPIVNRLVSAGSSM